MAGAFFCKVTMWKSECSTGACLHGVGVIWELSLRIYEWYIYPFSNVAIVSDHGIVYLNSLNIIQKTVVAGVYLSNSVNALFLKNINITYTKRGSKLYKNVP